MYLLQLLLKTHWELIWELFGNYLGTFWELCLFHTLPPQAAQGPSRYRRFLSLASFVEQGCQRAPSRICVWAHEFNLQKKTAPLAIIPLGRISADRHALIIELASRRWLVCGFFGHVFANGRDVRR